MALNQSKQKKITGQKAKGQVVVEYVLLLIVVVALATLMARLLVRRDPNDSGFVVKKWQKIITVIGSDIASEKNKEEP